MRMNQDERRFDFHGLGAALKRAREEKGWTQAYVAELVDRDSRTIMNIENKGQYPSFDLFVKLITMFDVSVDQLYEPYAGDMMRQAGKMDFEYAFGFSCVTQDNALHMEYQFYSDDTGYAISNTSRDVYGEIYICFYGE